MINMTNPVKRFRLFQISENSSDSRKVHPFLTGDIYLIIYHIFGILGG